MFAPLDTVRSGLAGICHDLAPDDLTPDRAAAAIDELAGIARLAEGAIVRLADRVDDTVTGAEGENGPARWLARHTGQSVTTAGRYLAASEALARLAATDRALRDGELTATQAHEVTSAAALDPGAEADLLALGRDGSLSELRRAAKKVRAAATDNDHKHRDAHENRDLGADVDDETGEGDLRARGPASVIAQMLALLEPWIQARFDHARKHGRRERRGALGFDALLDALTFADQTRRGTGSGSGGGLTLPDIGGPPTGPPVSILARVDVTAIQRGHTRPGETCEIDGLGPVPVEDLRRLLPQATIDLIVTNGVDAYNIVHLGRSTLARQQVVMDWIGGQCARLGCPATRHLQIDHRIDWAHTHTTELKALDWLCPADHRRKTHHNWALVHGRGKRHMVPPDHPDHPANAPPQQPAEPNHRANAPPDHPADAPPDRETQAA
jgi:hypothetical protein